MVFVFVLRAFIFLEWARYAGSQAAAVEGAELGAASQLLRRLRPAELRRRRPRAAAHQPGRVGAGSRVGTALWRAPLRPGRLGGAADRSGRTVARACPPPPGRFGSDARCAPTG